VFIIFFYIQVIFLLCAKLKSSTLCSIQSNVIEILSVCREHCLQRRAFLLSLILLLVVTTLKSDL